MFSRQTSLKTHTVSLLLIGTIILAVALSFTVFAHTALAATPHVDVMVLNSEIGPSSLQFLTHSIGNAEKDGAQALVIEVDTPGGDISAMESMAEAELNTTVPIITYVSPGGGYAASAGAFVTLAAQVAVMAPTTRIGASSPVDVTGADLAPTLKAKLEHDLVAFMTAIQNRYNRNVDLATAMVTNAASYDDATAVSQKIVDLEASSLPNLLSQVDGRSVIMHSGTVTLHTADATVQLLQPTLFDSLYGILLDPNVIFLLFIVAMIGIYLEISHPGAILPGTVGAIALLLFLFGIGSISVNWTGLALMVLAFVLLVLDVRVPTHGVLTIGAMISLIIGALLFFNSGSSYGGGPQVNPVLVYIMAVLLGLISFTLITFIVRAQRRPVTTGVESMIGAKVTALTPLLPEGRVRYGGEDWAAVLNDPTTTADANSELQVVAVDGLRLRVQPLRFIGAIPVYPTHSIVE